MKQRKERLPDFLAELGPQTPHPAIASTLIASMHCTAVK
jgi:hypothetical protein